MYCVTITHFEDDYKHRHDNGVYPQKPKMFKSKENAQKYVANEIADAIEERLECKERLMTEVKSLWI